MKACVDIGGTRVAVGLVHEHVPGGLVARRSEATATSGRPDAVALQVMRMVEQACAEAGVDANEVNELGVAAPGPFLLREGLVELTTPHICGGLAGLSRGLPNGWLSAPIEAPLRRRFGRVRVENEGVAALEAERRWGALQGFAHCAHVSWGAGIGVGLCVDGRVLRGKNRNAAHAGHSFVTDSNADAALCGCGNVGDVESLVGGDAIERRFGHSAATLFMAAARGDAQALRKADGLCTVVGRLLFNLVTTLDLQAISLGGSVFWHHRQFLLPRLRAAVEACLPSMTAGVLVVPAGLGDQVADCAALALLAGTVPGPRPPQAMPSPRAELVA